MAVLCSIVFWQVGKMYEDRSDVITEDYVMGKIQSISELAVSKTTYQGLIELSDASGIFSSEFYVKYTAQLKAYVDLSKASVTIEENNRIIKVTLPHAELKKPEIDYGDYQIYHSSFFESDSKDAINKALKDAEVECMKKIKTDALIAESDKSATNAVKNILESFTKLKNHILLR